MSMFRVRVIQALIWSVLASFCPSAQAAQPKPLGSETRVPDDPVDVYSEPAVAVDAVGDVIFAATRLNPFSSQASIIVVGFDVTGDLRFQETVCCAEGESPRDPQIAANAHGEFVVVWESRPSGGDFDVFARRFDAAGRTKDPTGILVNSGSTLGDQTRAAVSVDALGNFAVAWESRRDTAEILGLKEIKAKRFDGASGFAASKEFVVATGDDDLDNVAEPSVALSRDGKFVVVWDSDDDLIGDGNVRGRAYTERGAQGEAFEIAEERGRPDRQRKPDIAMNANGEYVVCWQDERTASGQGVFVRAFRFPDRPRTPQVLARDDTTRSQIDPSIAIDARGRFAVVWRTIFGDTPAVEGRLFAANGRPLGREFTASRTDSDALSLKLPQVAVDADGDMWIAWQKVFTTVENPQIRARRVRGIEEIDLALALRGKNTAVPGLPLSYSVSAGNAHPDEPVSGIAEIDSNIGAAINPVILLALPVGASRSREPVFVPPRSGRCRATGARGYKCEMRAPLKAQTRARIEFELIPTGPGELAVGASVLSVSLDPDLTDNSDARETEVISP